MSLIYIARTFFFYQEFMNDSFMIQLKFQFDKRLSNVLLT